MAKISNTKIVPNVPYRGIESFRFCDKDIFFAREHETQELLRFVTMYRGVLLYGDSGSGKSSLINAGFLPAALDEKFGPHRLRVQPREGEEIVIERISTSPEGGPPYLESIFDIDNSEPRQVVSVTAFKTKLAEFRVNDLEERIVLKLRSGKDALSRFIKSHLSDETNHLLGLHKNALAPLPEKTRAAFTADLKTLLRNKALYSKSRFSNIQLPNEIINLLTSELKVEDSIGLNRLLLEHAYPDEGSQRDRVPLLIFDQFEEFVTLFEIAPRGAALKEAQTAQKAILETVVDLLKNTSLPIKLVFVFREDYLAKLTKLFVQRPELTDQYLRLTSIRVERLNDIIKSPFQKFPGSFKPQFSDSLVADLRTAFESRSELGSINLSEVQTACLRLWQSSDPQNLFRQKGIQGLLEDYLSDALNKFPDELRDPSVALLTRLVTDSGTRNVVSKDDLIIRLHEEEDIPKDLLEQSLDKLESDTKLIRRERRYETFFYEIVSEFLVDWIRRQRIERRMHHEQRRLASQIERSKFAEKAREVTSRTSFNEREFVTQVEVASPEEFAFMLLRPSLEKERALRNFFGDERYQRLHSLALRCHVSRLNNPTPTGNVIIIPGFGGSLLGSNQGGIDEPLWMNSFGLVRGGLDVLRLSDDGRTSSNPAVLVRATGIMKRIYGELILALSLNWNVKTFYFDWRKDLNLAADELNLQVKTWFDNQSPVHIVAHSMGGLVARTFFKRYPEQWRAFWDRAGNGRAGGRLIMFGTPNHGSFTTVQLIVGTEGLVSKLAALDERHKVNEVVATLITFPGLYQMLPSPVLMPSMKDLYNSRTYSKFTLDIPQHKLDNALTHHHWLHDGVDFNRMIYVGGYDQPTLYDVADWNKLNKEIGYKLTLDGDGWVPHKLGPISSKSQRIPTYWIKENHGNLLNNAAVLKALDDLLKTGKTNLLAAELPFGRVVSRTQKELRTEYKTSQMTDVSELTVALKNLGMRGAPSDGPSRSGMLVPTTIGPVERKIEELITSRFLGYPSEDQAYESNSKWSEYRYLEIGVVYGGIESIDYERIKNRAGDPVDAIAVGHYIGVSPQYAELALDRAISDALVRHQFGSKYFLSADDLVITKLGECGFIQGMLGQLFFVQDPRTSNTRRSKTTDRQVVIAGMGESGRFGTFELITLSSGLTWTLGKQNRKHLATVLIGSGNGNLSLRDALSSWLTGVGRAVAKSKFDSQRRLQRITFVEYDPRRVLQLDRLLIAERLQSDSGVEIVYEALTDAQRVSLAKASQDRDKDVSRASFMLDMAPEREKPWDWMLIPTRVSLRLDPDTKSYSFSAIRGSNLLPEQDALIDPKLIWGANNELVGQQSASTQLDRGQFLEGLLFPQNLRKELYGSTPLVMRLDPITARIHWEVVAQPSPGRGPRKRGTAHSFEDNFVGTARGLTRQLLTKMPSPPEPPAAELRDTLKVLIVADPAPEAHLPGAEEEGVLIADLFNSYNLTAGDRHVDVRCLLGPTEATHMNVLRELMVQPYDVLHFTGYCVFEWDGDPTLSGWIFDAKEKTVLRAQDLPRRYTPKFIFSNASEIGVTPGRADERNDRLAPSLAEAFLCGGVQNFICAAWPVDDIAARTFALSLYSHLLGTLYGEPLPMYEAMRRARLEVAQTPNGRTDWGAYQHYGNPSFRFFNTSRPKHEIVKSQTSAKRRNLKPVRTKDASQKPRGKK